MDHRFRRSLPTALARRLLDLPEPLIQRIAGPPVEVDGRVLNRNVQLLAALAERSGRSGMQGGTAEQRRADLRRVAGIGMPTATGLHVVDRVIPGPVQPLPVRVYRPFGLEPEPPAIVYYHGGGWVVGDLDTHDGSCRLLALESRCVVVSVDYRLAPEHPFPAAPDDALAAYCWVAANGDELGVDGTNVAVMGDSAGGNLAAVVSQAARSLEVPPPVAQGLVYPGVDFRMGTASIESFAEGFFLTRESMHWFRDQYLPDRDLNTNPMVSPLLAEDLSGLAPTWVWTAGFDPLRDEGRAYADALAKAGVEVHHRCFDDQVHGFFGMGILPGGLELVAEVCRQMGDLVHTHRR